MKKKIIFIFIVLILLIPVFAFAGGKKEAAKEEPAAAAKVVGPQYGGTFTMHAGASEPPSPDIKDGHHAALFWLEPIQERPIHGDMEKYGPRGNGEYAFQLVAYIPAKYMKGHLISKWEITREKMVWTVRDGVMWQSVKGVMDARPLTAEDIVKDIIRFMESPWGGRFKGLLGKVYAEGNKVIMEYENYSPDVFYFLGYEDRAIISPPETTAAGADKWENQGGTGAFKFQEYVVGSHMSYVKNPDYWDKTTIDGVEYKMPFVDKLVKVVIPDVSTGVAALRTGKIDMYRNVPTDQWDTIDKTIPDLEKNRYGDMVQAIVLKCSEPPFDNVNVRRAMMIGTDLAVFRRFGRAESFPLQCFPAWPGNPGVYTPMEKLPAEAKELFKYDPEKAKKMLADAGYPNGFKMDFYVSSDDVTNTDFGALLQSEWAKIGVTVNVVPHDYVTYRTYRDTFTYKDSIICGTQIGNAVGSVTNLLKTDAWLNYAKYSNKRVDELADQITAEMDPEKQDRLIKEAAVIAITEVANIGAYLMPQAYYWWPWVKNYYGEVSIEDGEIGALIPYLWIDQDLKKKMGF
jgi:peptide/nickel transport system substrate-binding protein